MKIVVDHTPPPCPECGGSTEWKGDAIIYGSYAHTSFYCRTCRLYIPAIAGSMVAQSKTDDAIIWPDEIIVMGD